MTDGDPGFGRGLPEARGLLSSTFNSIQRLDRKVGNLMDTAILKRFNALAIEEAFGREGSRDSV